jgi:predicted nuclease of restriction endonuclease-like (RecB) superfamily
MLLGVKNHNDRLWYMERTLEHGWSHDWLAAQEAGRE